MDFFPTKNMSKIEVEIFKETCQIHNRNNRKFCLRCCIEKCLVIEMKIDGKEGKESPHFKPDIENYPINRNVYEQVKLAEVQNAMSAFGDLSSVQPVGQVETFLQAVNLAELFVHQSVQFCYRLSSFSTLKLSDQLVLLKSSHSEIAPVFAAFLYDKTLDRFPVLVDMQRNTALWITNDISRQLKQKGLAQRFRSFANAMQDKMENDTAIRDLIMAQLLFKPRDNLTCPEFIRYIHLFYCHLLRRYLENKYAHSSQLGWQKFCSIMSILSQMSRVTAMMQQVYTSEIESFKVAHVIAEIYNLI